MSTLHLRTIIRKNGATPMMAAVLLTEENLSDVAVFANSTHFGLVRVENGELVIKRKYEDARAVPGMWVGELGDTFAVVENIEDWIDFDRPGLPLTTEFESRVYATVAVFEEAHRHPLGHLEVVQAKLTEAGRTAHDPHGWSDRLGFAVQLTEENPKAISLWLRNLTLPSRIFTRYAMNADGTCVLRVSDSNAEPLDLLPGNWLVWLNDKLIKVGNVEFSTAFDRVSSSNHTPLPPQRSSDWDM